MPKPKSTRSSLPTHPSIDFRCERAKIPRRRRATSLRRAIVADDRAEMPHRERPRRDASSRDVSFLLAIVAPYLLIKSKSTRSSISVIIFRRDTLPTARDASRRSRCVSTKRPPKTTESSRNGPTCQPTTWAGEKRDLFHLL